MKSVIEFMASPEYAMLSPEVRAFMIEQFVKGSSAPVPAAQPSAAPAAPAAEPKAPDSPLFTVDHFINAPVQAEPEKKGRKSKVSDREIAQREFYAQMKVKPSIHKVWQPTLITMLSEALLRSKNGKAPLPVDNPVLRLAGEPENPLPVRPVNYGVFEASVGQHVSNPRALLDDLVKLSAECIKAGDPTGAVKASDFIAAVDLYMLPDSPKVEGVKIARETDGIKDGGLAWLKKPVNEKMPYQIKKVYIGGKVHYAILTTDAQISAFISKMSVHATGYGGTLKDSI